MKKVVVDADLLIDHVMQEKESGPSALRQLMGKVFCYTTVFSAIEAFGVCQSGVERSAVERSMNALKILGLNAKSGKNIGRLFAQHGEKDSLHILAAGICLESRLPLVTGRPEIYQGIDGLTVTRPDEALQN